MRRKEEVTGQSMAPAEQSAGLPHFSLLGGPLHRFGTQLGLVRADTNTLPLGMVIGAILGGVWVILNLTRGENPFVLSNAATLTRLFLAIPLLFLSETILGPRLTQFIGSVVRSGIVPGEALPRFSALIKRVTDRQNGWVPDVVCLAGALTLTWIMPQLRALRLNWGVQDPIFVAPTFAQGWYWIVCLTVFRFLLLRWVWRLCVWTFVLWVLSRMPLRLQPSHPDGVAGLGNLEVVHEHFASLILNISVVLASSFAVDIAAGTLTVEEVYPRAGVVLILDAVLFIGPLMFFLPKLAACRVQGIIDYSDLSERYARTFEAKWFHTRSPTNEPLLGSPDIQSLADLGAGFNRVRDMRWVPMGKALLVRLMIAAILPFLPLLLFKYHIITLSTKLITRLIGL
jgi:hypothetical protein